MSEGSGRITGELSRDLSLFHITMMGLGMMIGAGVFVGIGFGAGTVGPGGLLVVMALNGVVAFFSAMSFAELSSAIPRAGGATRLGHNAVAAGEVAAFLDLQVRPVPVGVESAARLAERRLRFRQLRGDDTRRALSLQ